MQRDLKNELKQLYDATELACDETASKHVRMLAEGLDALSKIVDAHKLAGGNEIYDPPTHI
ncbi:MAG TPA: hypothetical protein VMM76_28740 [Pirellulaceae bacterium]|nr:hypothetical protein [Pirellulaceae bacterium]